MQQKTHSAVDGNIMKYLVSIVIIIDWFIEESENTLNVFFEVPKIEIGPSVSIQHETCSFGVQGQLYTQQHAELQGRHHKIDPPNKG